MIRPGRNATLYPVMGTHIRFKINAGNRFFPGRTYEIVGFGYGRPKFKNIVPQIALKSILPSLVITKPYHGVRREFWIISDKHNDHIEDRPIWKSELNRLWDEEKIIETPYKTM